MATQTVVFTSADILMERKRYHADLDRVRANSADTKTSRSAHTLALALIPLFLVLLLLLAAGALMVVATILPHISDPAERPHPATFVSRLYPDTPVALSSPVK